MDRLYTPWRKEYVRSLDQPDGCVLCGVRDSEDAEVNVLLREAGWFVVLNKYPYTTGHMMMVTDQHIGSMAELSAEAAQSMPGLLARCESALRETYRPHGLNVGLNLGRAAGAGVHGHLHWHLLPRWEGDSNFATVVADTRVLPETLEESYARLREFFGRSGA